MEQELRQINNTPIEIELNGKKYKISALTLDDLAEFDNYSLSQKVKAVMEATKGLPQDERIEFVNNILNSTSEMDDFQKALNTISGVRFFLYRALKRNNPDIELDTLGELVTMDNLEELSSIVSNLSVDSKKK